MKIFILADCNNFFVSCEQVFNPKLLNKPVVVLSNNDGCVIARSNEAKALGIVMGVPYFQIKKRCKAEGIVALSSNYLLYADMSARVMQALKKFTSEIEVYSIDEAFFRLDNCKGENALIYAEKICRTITQWTGIPLSMGIASTKTLAKVANHWAKRFKKIVFSMLDSSAHNLLLHSLLVNELWGIGGRIAHTLNMMGIGSALQLRDANPSWIRQQVGTVVERIVRELNGVACLDLTPTQARKGIGCAKSFGKGITELPKLEEVLSYYASTVCHKLRMQQSIVPRIQVLLQTNRFLEGVERYDAVKDYYFEYPTQDTRQVITAAKQCLRQLYKAGYIYQKVGIMLIDLLPATFQQKDLFANVLSDDHSCRVMRLIDNINDKLGKNTIFLAAQGTECHWQRRSQWLSPDYIGDWNQLLSVR